MGLFRGAALLATGVMVSCLSAGCSGASDQSDDANKAESPTSSPPSASASPTASPSEASPSATASEPVAVDAEELIVPRDKDDSGHWETDDPDVPSPPNHTTNESCSEFNGHVFMTEKSETEAAVGWFDPKTNNVSMSGQVVRVYPTAADAEAAVDELRAFVKDCKTWRESPDKSGGWFYETTMWTADGLPEDAIAWRVKTGVVGLHGHTASTWHVTTRYDNVVTTVASTSLDDVAAQAQQDARDYATEAGQLILEAQGESTDTASATPSASASSSTPPKALPPPVKCARKPGNPGEIYVWSSSGNDQPPDAMRLGAGYVWDFGDKECITTTEFALRSVPVGLIGYCSEVGRVSDNPGYPVNARPAPRLASVIGRRGDC